MIKFPGLPNQEELQGAVKGLERLQHVYNLTANELVDRVSNSIQADSSSLWKDCFEIGVQLYELAKYQGALEWLQLASSLLEDVDSENARRMAAEVYEYLALTYIALGQKERAVEILKELLSWFSPTTPHPARYILDSLEYNMPKSPKESTESALFANFSRLCQGKRLPEPDSGSESLRCYLDFDRHPRFKLSPLKVEQVHLNPDINMYYDVLNDAQINAVIEQSDQFDSFRSMVVGNVVTDTRVSQQVWQNYTSYIIKSLANIVGAISGFDMQNAEEMQIANYGIGGQYAAHFDYFSKLPDRYILGGDRISTNMFYVSVSDCSL